MYFYTVVSEFIFLICSYGTFIRLISGNELHSVENKNMTMNNLISSYIGELNERLDFIEFCKSTNLDVLVMTDEESSSITVSFEVSHPEFKNCFKYYNITLKKQEKIENYSVVRYRDDRQGGAAYEFKHVHCGIYEITIQPCYNSWQCAPFIIKYPDQINMTSFQCVGLVTSKKLITELQFEKKTIIILGGISVFLILIASGMMFWYYKSEFDGEKVTSFKEDEFREVEDCPTRKIEVYIINYYSKNTKNKWNIKMFKEFCLLTGYFDSVKTITDELSLILLNINDHLNKMLEKTGEDGRLRKIVLFVSDNDEEDEEYELENIIFSKFIGKIKDNMEECLHGYDHFFVVKLDSAVNCSEVFKGVVPRNRFIFSDKLIHDHLINLCLNICNGSNLNLLKVEKTLRELLAENPVNYFEIVV